MNKQKLMVTGIVVAVVLVILEFITDMGTFITNHFYSPNAPATAGDNIAFYVTITLVALGAILLFVGLTYNWLKRTKSYIYKGSAVLFGSTAFFCGFMILWFIAFYIHGLSQG